MNPLCIFVGENLKNKKILVTSYQFFVQIQSYNNAVNPNPLTGRSISVQALPKQMPLE